MTDWCLTCGQFAELEAHHVAGRHNHRALTVALCPDCHRVLSGWQLASGVELDVAAERTELDATRALVVGAMQLLQLFAQRHAECSWLPAELLTHSGRAASRMLDGCGPADRPGRWLPDPTVPPCEATPVGWPKAAELARTSQFAHLVLALAQILGEPPPIPAEQLTDIAADPRGVRRGLSRTTGGRVGHGAAAAPGQLSGHGPADHPGAAQLRRPIVAGRTAG
jgi:hypothetical protein